LIAQQRARAQLQRQQLAQLMAVRRASAPIPTPPRVAAGVEPQKP
jgi:Tfp pilus assembly protein PilV